MLVRSYFRYCHPSYLTTSCFVFLALLIVLPRPPDSKLDSKATLCLWRIPECFPQAATCSNASSKGPCEDSKLELYHKVTFDLVKVYNLTLAVHPAVEVANA